LWTVERALDTYVLDVPIIVFEKPFFSQLMDFIFKSAIALMSQHDFWKNVVLLISALVNYITYVWFFLMTLVSFYDLKRRVIQGNLISSERLIYNYTWASLHELLSPCTTSGTSERFLPAPLYFHYLPTCLPFIFAYFWKEY